MPLWSDFYKFFVNAREKDPISKKRDPATLVNVGTSQPDALHTLGAEGAAGGMGGGSINYRQSNEMIDVTTLANRTQRYKEYDRLRNLPEIEQVMTVISDEACVSGDTKIATPFGHLTIEWLAENKAPDERFLVYCWDFKKNDYTLGWAWNPRKVKKSPTVKVVLDDGNCLIVTDDHRILKRNEEWCEAGKLQHGDHLMPFYRIPANFDLTGIRINQFPRIYSHNRGWIHERMFVDEWKNGTINLQTKKIYKIMRLIAKGMPVRKASEMIGHDWITLESWIHKEGFSLKELRCLNKKKGHRRVIGIFPGPEIDVYDLSVEKHQCFCTDSVIMHNCQEDNDGNIFQIDCENEQISKEIEWLLLNRKMLNLNRRSHKWFKNMCINGDWFVELVVHPDAPEDGIGKVVPLPPESMYRIETNKGRLVEFQQSAEGPDYNALTKPVETTSEEELQTTKALRFAPGQIVHFRIGDDRTTFYPYGQSLIEPARGPAHQLRLMEDAMLVYRLSRAPERRVFYIDVGQLPPFKAEAFIDRMKDQFRKRKVTGGGTGANAAEEKWQPPAQDEDYWLPVRPNSNTKIDTLPGAQSLGEIDDAIYFRNKLFTSLNFPKNYFSNEDPNATRITLSSQDVKFARMIERLQNHFLDGIWDICERHLELRGFPEESWDTLTIKMTPPSDWRELSRQEVIAARISNITQLKSSQFQSDYDLYTKWMHYSEEETEEMLSRLKLQKLEDLKLQVLAQNPIYLGLGVPGEEEQQGQEMGAEPGGPNPNPMGGEMDQSGMDGMNPGMGSPDQSDMSPPQDSQKPPKPEGSPIPDPDEKDIKKFDLEIEDYETEQDEEDIDYSVTD